MYVYRERTESGSIYSFPLLIRKWLLCIWGGIGMGRRCVQSLNNLSIMWIGPKTSSYY